MKMEMYKLREVTPAGSEKDYKFFALIAPFAPWNGVVESDLLDMEYYGNISGNKFVSPLISSNLGADGRLSVDSARSIARLIVTINRPNWEKLWDTMQLEYNPIENYSMTEQMTDDATVTEYGKTRTRTNDLTHKKTGNETDTPNITETQTPNLSNDTESRIHGFNSTEGVPTGEQSQKATGTNTNTQTGTETREYNVTDADTGTQTENDGGKDMQTRNYKLTRSGNIGVTTSQQMIESERQLWDWNYFYNVVFPDVDRILTLQIY